MAQRKLQEVDASSIADVAFILLAFIIIITTLQKEEGIPAVLPQKRDTPLDQQQKVKERNLLEILVNKNDQLMIEGEWNATEEDIIPTVEEFFTNPENKENFPSMETVTLQGCKEKIAYFTQLNKETKSGAKYDPEIKKWNKKLAAVKLVGEYKTVNKFATVAIQYDKGTSYGTYLEVRDKVMSGLNNLRNRLSKKVFNESYSALVNTRLESFGEDTKALEEHKAKINSIRAVYPQKIIKLPARNVQ